MYIKKYYLESLGCAKNQVDSELMMSFLERKNWVPAKDPGEAELIIVNTCGFIEPAREESIDTILSFRKLYPDKKILMTGCLVQRYASELYDDLKEADGFFGNNFLQDIDRVASSVLEGKREIFLGDKERISEEQYRIERKRLLSFPGSAYVKISEGCNNRCTYCSIPIIRGDLKSRSIESVIIEIEHLLEIGIRELNIIAQDLASFGKDRNTNFMELMKRISEIKGDFWVRLLYFHPDNFEKEILSLMKNDPRFLPYFDLPFQHAAKKILKKMGRRGDGEEYLKLISLIRNTLPGAVIRSTFLVGFPGETKEDFKELVDFQKRAELDWLGVFTYSREEGTPAYGFRKRVPEKVALSRKSEIERLQVGISERRLERFVGANLDILVEEEVREEGLFIGRAYIDAPEVDGAVVFRTSSSVRPGELIRCRITGRAGFDLEAVDEGYS